MHEFLLRHTYIDPMRMKGMSSTKALALTFGISIIAHEIVIFAALTPTHPPPILALLSLFQFPLMPLMRQPFFKDKVGASSQCVLGIAARIVGGGALHMQ